MMFPHPTNKRTDRHFVVSAIILWDNAARSQNTVPVKASLLVQTCKIQSIALSDVTYSSTEAGM